MITFSLYCQHRCRAEGVIYGCSLIHRVTATRSGKKKLSSFGFLYATTLLQQLLFSQLTSNWMLRISIRKCYAFCPTCMYFPYISSVVVAVNPTSLHVSCTKEKRVKFLCLYTAWHLEDILKKEAQLPC